MLCYCLFFSVIYFVFPFLVLCFRFGFCDSVLGFCDSVLGIGFCDSVLRFCDSVLFLSATVVKAVLNPNL